MKERKIHEINSLVFLLPHNTLQFVLRRLVIMILSLHMQINVMKSCLYYLTALFIH